MNTLDGTIIRSTLNNNPQCLEHINIFSLIFQHPVNDYVSQNSVSDNRSTSDCSLPPLVTMPKSLVLRQAST